MNQQKGKVMIAKGKPYPLGVSYQDSAFHISMGIGETEECTLNLYKKGKSEPEYCFSLDKKFRYGNLLSVAVKGEQLDSFEYTFTLDGREITDPYARKITGREVFGVGKAGAEKREVRGQFIKGEFDWGEDEVMCIPYHKSVLYQLHVRGFTKHSSSGVKKKGTFSGLTEKIAYLKNLGITGVLLMPVYDFNEVKIRQTDESQGYETRFQELEKKEGVLSNQLNYWGYGKDNQYFVPKGSYSSNPNEADREMKNMVKSFHSSGIEVLMEFYFPPETNTGFILSCLCYWVLEYHIDGFKLNQDVVPFDMLRTEPILADRKLIGDYWDTGRIYAGGVVPRYLNLGEISYDYPISMRRFLKGDEGMVEPFLYHFRKHQSKMGSIHRITSHNGFTMMDLYSYERKHNEENGENNQDGSDNNYSWNCGTEGKTRKKKIGEMRIKQMKNAFFTMIFSQGTPLFLAGDEFCNSQGGNNNAYCQDNAISWLNWGLLKQNQNLFESVKVLIQIRKDHPILHMEKEFSLVDTLSCGCPDLSFHGTKSWYPNAAPYSRMIGIMFSGEYAELENGQKDDYFYLAFNMHWEEHTFDLPALPVGYKWFLLFDSQSEVLEKSVYHKDYLVKPRTVLLFISRKTEEKNQKPEKSKKIKGYMDGEKHE